MVLAQRPDLAEINGIERQTADNPTVGQYDVGHPDYMKWFCARCETQHDVPVECPREPKDPRRGFSGSFNNLADPRYVDDPRPEQERIHRETST